MLAKAKFDLWLWGQQVGSMTEKEVLITASVVWHIVRSPLTPEFLMSDLCRWYYFTAHFSHNQPLAYFTEEITIPLNPGQMIHPIVRLITEGCIQHTLCSTISFLPLPFINKLILIQDLFISPQKNVISSRDAFVGPLPLLYLQSHHNSAGICWKIAYPLHPWALVLICPASWMRLQSGI